MHVGTNSVRLSPSRATKNGESEKRKKERENMAEEMGEEKVKSNFQRDM